MNLLLPSLKTILLISTFLVISILLLPIDIMQFILQEHGIIESLSALFWFVSAGFVIYSKNIKYKLLALYPLIFSLREISIRQIIYGDNLTNSIFKISYYTDNSIPLDNKLFFGILITMLIVLLILSIAMNVKTYFINLINKNLPATYVLLSGVFLVISQLLFDKPIFQNILSPYITITSYFSLVMEELLELMASVLVLLASINVFYRSKK